MGSTLLAPASIFVLQQTMNFYYTGNEELLRIYALNSVCSAYTKARGVFDPSEDSLSRKGMLCSLLSLTRYSASKSGGIESSVDGGCDAGW